MKPLADYIGKDRLMGRPIRLNQVELVVPSGKDYTQLLFWGDLHKGHPQCEVELAMQSLEWAKRNHAYILCMGDMVECGTKTSIGDSVYTQTLNPQEQMESIIEMLTPYKERIIGFHAGNHEIRIQNATGVNVSKIMAKELGVPYLGYSCWSLLRVGSQKYSIYSTHGVSGAKFKHTKIKSLMDVLGWISGDIIAQGHVHSIATEAVLSQQVDFRNRTVVEKKSYVVLTGSYLSWDKSYAQAANMPLTTLGSPRCKLSAVKHDIWFSV